MFQLLSKQIHIFSIPVFILLLFLGIATFNIFYFTVLQSVAFGITFLSIFIGFFLFRSINLSYNQNLPYFLYSLYCFTFIPTSLDIFWSVSFLINNLIIYIISNKNEKLRLKSYYLIGCLLAIDFFLTPSSFFLFIFIILHLVFTSNFILKNLFQLFMGVALIVVNYMSLQYITGHNLLDYGLIPHISLDFEWKAMPLSLLGFLLLILIYSIFDHFLSIRKKSPQSRYIYGLLLMYFGTLCIQIFFYMGDKYEYFLLLSVPLCIIYSRGLVYMKAYWMKEVSLSLIILSLIIFKISYFFEV